MSSHGVWKIVQLQAQLRKLKQQLGVEDMEVAVDAAAVFHGEEPDVAKRLAELQTALISFGEIVDSFQTRIDSDLKGLTDFLDDDECQIENLAGANAQLTDAVRKAEAALSTQHAEFLASVNELRKVANPDAKPLGELPVAMAELRSLIRKK